MASQKKTVNKSPIAMSVAKYEKAYDKNFNKMLRESSSEIRKANEKTRGGRSGSGGVKVIERLAEKARRETNKELGFTEAEARKRDQQKKTASPRVKAEATARRYKKGSYKK